MKDLPRAERRGLLAAVALGSLGLLLVGAVLYLDGRLPAARPEGGPDYAPEQLDQTLVHVRADGRVDYAALARDHWHLDTFLRGIAANGPVPEGVKLTREAETAYWLNVANAMGLEVLVGAGELPERPVSPLQAWTRSWPVAGERLTLHALADRVLPALEDPRVYFAVHDGALSGPRLPRQAFPAEGMDAALNAAVRDFFARPDALKIGVGQVELSKLVLDHQEAILEALPKNRPRSLLQFVWAFLPEGCDERPGCETRAELDRACGTRLEGCKLSALPWDDRLDAVTR